MAVLLICALLQDKAEQAEASRAKQAEALIDQLNLSAHAYVAETGRLPKSIDSLIRSGFLLIDAEPKDPWGNSIRFDQAGGTLTIGVTLEKRLLSREVKAATIIRRKRLVQERTAAAIDSAVQAYRHIHGSSPDSMDALCDTPGVLLGKRHLAKITVRLKARHVRISIPAPPSEPLSQQQRAELKKLLDDLSAEAVKKRDQAVARILKLGPATLDVIRKALATSKDLELAGRLQVIERELARTQVPIVINYYFHRRERGDKAEDRASMARNERDARACLKSIAVAQNNFKSYDLDGNKVNDYWTADIAGLYCLQAKSTGNVTGALSDINLASADAHKYSGAYENDHIRYAPTLLLAHAPKVGYLFRAIQFESGGAAYARDTDGSGMKVHNESEFAVTSYPNDYGDSGIYTYIANESGSIYRRDTGGVPVIRWPSDFESNNHWEKVK